MGKIQHQQETITRQELDQLRKDCILSAHPIGSYYWSDQSIDPSTIFGGQWMSISGAFLYAVDNNHAVNTKGGEETHALTKYEIPKFIDTYYCDAVTGQSGPYCLLDKTSIYTTADAAIGLAQNLDINAQGGNAHNNMPPYLAAYLWKRIA